MFITVYFTVNYQEIYAMKMMACNLLLKSVFKTRMS